MGAGDGEGGTVTALRGCPYCPRFMRWNQYACDECNGTNGRESYRKRSTNLAACLRDAAVEEMRVRAAVDRVLDMWSLA